MMRGVFIAVGTIIAVFIAVVILRVCYLVYVR